MGENREKAEVFDALGHPTRISILKLLSQGPLSFADLKKRTNIASSGHLQHHLLKLDGLIKTDEHGNYCLSDAGSDALFAMSTVEASARRGKRRLPYYSLKSTILLTAFVIVLAACLVVSTFYLSNVNSSISQSAIQATSAAQNQIVNSSQSFAEYLTQLQNAGQNQYVLDVMTGSLAEDGHEVIGPADLFDLEPQECFNYTAMVFWESNPPPMGYVLHDASTVDFPLPIRNDTYYRQGFLVYDLTVFGPHGYDVVNATIYPISGPDGWNGQIVWPFYQDVPPFRTAGTYRTTMGLTSGGIPSYFTSTIPIDTSGNYTFSVKNEGNTTIQISYKVTTPVVILEIIPLKEADFPAWSSRWAEERIVRIRKSPTFASPSWSSPSTPSFTIPDVTTTSFSAMTLAVLSTAVLAALSIFAINRRRR